MTHKERFINALNRQQVDELPRGDSLWGETYHRYIEEGHLAKNDDIVSHFDMSWRSGGWINGLADLDFKEQIVEETDDTVLKLNGNGAQLRYWKARTGTPEHVAFAVTEREAWEERIKPHLLKVDRRRIPFENYRKAREKAQQEERAFIWSGVAPFEQMHPVCGHEHMLVGMALDPEWIQDMVMTFARFSIMHQKVLFAEEGMPDAMWYYEDMGFKERPFMSPDMYREIIQPGHKLLFDDAHSNGLKVIVHSCGFVEPLVPGMIEAGMDCLQAMEVKAGMSLVRLAKNFGDKIAFCGGLDIREVASNDHDRIRKEVMSKVAEVLNCGTGYILHSDHSIPPEVDYESLKYFFSLSKDAVT